MWTELLILLFFLFNVSADIEESEPVLYYYGIEESERGLPACGPKQACAALVKRYWKPPALLRLCRCDRRQRCDTPLPTPHRIELNNRAELQFCQPITNWTNCTIKDIPLKVESTQKQMNPDEIEELHHKNIQLTPPKLTFTCKCRDPNYWRLNTSYIEENRQIYQCGPLPMCSSGEYCGNVSYDLFALYQSCLCPKHHICVHKGGVSNVYISELLYRGKGWRAACERIEDDDSNEYY